MAKQGVIMSEQCPTGGKEAEETFQLGRKFQRGAKGYPRDIAKAERHYEGAIKMGSAKAALALGLMYRVEYFSRPDRANRHKYMIGLFEHARKLGCPEAYLFLAEAYDNGWGVCRDEKKAFEMGKKAAEGGAPSGMGQYGAILIDRGQYTEGVQWLKRSLAMGHGDAGYDLANYYIFDMKNTPEYIDSLREGAKFGSKKCLRELGATYVNGLYGQQKDKRYAECFFALSDKIDDFESPAPIKDFDELCPPRPVIPYSDKE